MSTPAIVMAVIVLLVNGALAIVSVLIFGAVWDNSRARKRRREAARAVPTIPRFATIGGCMTAAYRMDFLPGDRIGCAHCPWTGNSAPEFASHLLTCGDTDEGNHL